jgi:hypothetical protein
MIDRYFHTFINRSSTPDVVVLKLLQSPYASLGLKIALYIVHQIKTSNAQARSITPLYSVGMIVAGEGSLYRCVTSCTEKYIFYHEILYEMIFVELI